ncbi:MAG: glycosyltransferase [Candidatus Saccharibacteria bacterium]|nr:glycosyltransferase [Candidatus Saccharibacteria bacterium]
MANNIVVNMVSESDISVQGHGVHTSYDEIASALEARGDVTVIRGDFGHQTDCDVVHFHTIGPRTWRKLLQRGPKKVVTAHVVPDSFVGSIILAKYWLFAARWYMRWYYNRADKVLAVSGMVADTLHDELHVPKAKIVTMYNTIDMSRYHPTATSKVAARQELRIDPDAFVVLGNGQVQPRKRLDVFVAMAQSLPDVQFIWVGGIPFKQLGADFKSMDKLMHALPSNMRITGVIPHRDVKHYMQAADLFCLPADQENHPMCVLEAASAELPIILRDIPEYDDTFGNNVVRCATNAAFIAAVTDLRQPVQQDRWRLKTKKIAQTFDSQTAADELMRLYRSLV